MMRPRSLFLLLSLFAPCSTVVAAGDPDVERAKAQIVEQLLQDSPDSRNTELQNANRNPSEYIQNLLATLNPDGSWKDIDYADQTRAVWKPALHTRRLVTMAWLFADPRRPLHRNGALNKAIHSTLGHWLLKNYMASNWWYNDIGTPTAMANFLLLFEKELTPEEKLAGLKIVGRSNISSTGQNRIWIASNHLRRGLLREDLPAIQNARDVIMKEVAVAPIPVDPKPVAGKKPVGPSAEGVQADWSFHQHGPMLQFGNYGLAFANEIPAWAEALRGTRWAMLRPAWSW